MYIKRNPKLHKNAVDDLLYYTKLKTLLIFRFSFYNNILFEK